MLLIQPSRKCMCRRIHSFGRQRRHVTACLAFDCHVSDNEGNGVLTTFDRYSPWIQVPFLSYPTNCVSSRSCSLSFMAAVVMAVLHCNMQGKPKDMLSPEAWAALVFKVQPRTVPKPVCKARGLFTKYGLALQTFDRDLYNCTKRRLCPFTDYFRQLGQ